jgi:three-Cys-motif partner protein
MTIPARSSKIRRRRPSDTVLVNGQLARRAGPWAQVKLGILEDYLRGFARASTSSPARIYIDPFCGPGKNLVRRGPLLDGSPLIAMSVVPAFTQCMFLDLEHANIAAVRARIAQDYPNHRATIISEPRDCNAALPTLLGQLPRDAATFAFLDPGGVNLEWPTVRALARHKGNHPWKVEQFILFPYNFGIARMLNPDNPEFFARMSPTLDAIFGNDEWGQDLQHRGKRVRGEVLRQRLTERYMGQLRGQLGYTHVIERLISTPDGHPLYYLIYASDHDVGGKIMRHAFGQDDHGSQLSMLHAEYQSMRQSRYIPVPGWDRFDAGLRAVTDDEQPE